MFEADADVQLTRFRTIRRTSAQVMQDGLCPTPDIRTISATHCNGGGWRYFTFSGVTWWSVIGPLAMTLVFLNISNEVIERGLVKRRPGYAEYIARTNAFFPRLHVASADDTTR